VYVSTNVTKMMRLVRHVVRDRIDCNIMLWEMHSTGGCDRFIWLKIGIVTRYYEQRMESSMPVIRIL
jgi:hypothetical protein